MSRLVVLVVGFLALMGAPLAMADALDDGRRAFATGDHPAARGHFSEAFEDGNAEAGFLLARMLEGGLGGQWMKRPRLRFTKRLPRRRLRPRSIAWGWSTGAAKPVLCAIRKRRLRSLNYQGRYDCRVFRYSGRNGNQDQSCAARQEGCRRCPE
ncbi:hypothetical protein [Martelella sp. FOR1707]